MLEILDQPQHRQRQKNSKRKSEWTRLKAEHVSFFGDMAMFQNEPRSATITAWTDCVLYEVTRDDFTGFCDKHPHLGLKILRKMAVVLSERIRKGNADVLKLTTALSIALTK